MEIQALRKMFDRQMRRDLPGDTQTRMERDETIVRAVGVDESGWNLVLWSSLDEANAGAVIAGEIERFGALGREFEWKYHDYDSPADLEQRLLEAGFVADEDESVMIGEVATMPRSAPPEGIRIVEVVDEAGVDAMIDVHRTVFGDAKPEFRAQLLGQITSPDREHVLVLAMAGDRAVCAARAEYQRGLEFASLWGGGTLAEWRGKGIYRAMVSHRADIAAERGFRYLHVDASPDSRPILERLGFVKIARTTPYVWSPS